MKTYRVGGSVRDELLGRPLADRDYVVVGATPDELFALGFRPVGRDFPVFLPHPGTAENPWDATATRTNRQTLATGGDTPSYLSLTTLPGR